MNRSKVRRITFFTLFVFITLVSVACLHCQGRKPPEDLHQVLRIIDGDTIVVNYHGQKEIIRLLRINTPERKRYGYRQATEAMTELVSGKYVRLEFEPAGKIRRDRYKRILAYVWLDGLNVNVEVVRLGWSRF